MSTKSRSTKKAGESRRDFLYLSTAAMAATGAVGSLWPFINSLNPSADVKALSKTTANISGLEPGQSLTVNWQGKPVYIRRRTTDEIKEARDVSLAALPDPQTDEDRVIKEEWLVVVGVCTHLGCRPSGQKAMDQKGEYGGWLCPCHGSHYDTSGRIRKGPAPTNLPVPPYVFLSDTEIEIG